MSAQPVVSVFGGSTPAPGSAAYEQARCLGALLAQAGFAVATGGYSGVMEAASRGASEAGGHVIGVTCDLIENNFSRRVNPWVAEKIHYVTVGERLRHLVEKCDAAIALPGGIGTLSEIALTWSLLQTGEIVPKPLILVGDVWRDTVTAFLRHADGYVREEHRRLPILAADEAAAIEKLRVTGK